jgi:hypothetical protein
MRRTIVIFYAGIINLLMLDACSELSNDPADPQFVQIHFQYGFKNELNTFNGTYQKDLVMDGIIKVPFWLTTSEQNMIVEKVLAVNFFAFPDTFYRIQDLIAEPDPSPDFLRVKYGNYEKAVVWFLPMDTNNSYAQSLRELAELIKAIIEANPEYKKLPPARGGYL